MRSLHEVLAWLLVAGNAISGIWALLAHHFAALRRSELWYLVAVVYVLIVAQVVLGVVVMQSGDQEINGTHVFYGFVSAFAVGIIHSYRQQLEQWRYLLFGFANLFLMGMALRTIYIPAYL